MNAGSRVDEADPLPRLSAGRNGIQLLSSSRPTCKDVGPGLEAAKERVLIQNGAVLFHDSPNAHIHPTARGIGLVMVPAGSFGSFT